MSGHRPLAPWTTAQARAVAVCDLVAALVVVAAGYQAGHEPSLGDQVVWIDLAVVGLLLATIANGTLFLLARRAIGRRRLALVPDVVAPVLPVAAPATDAPAGPWLWLAGTTRAHLEGCPMIAGKPARPITPARIRSKHLTRCELCG